VGLSWQQGPLSPGAIGHFLVPEPLPKRLLYVEPLRRRMRVQFGGTCPYKGLCSYYDIGDARLAEWSYRDAYAEVGRISGLVSFEPDIVAVQLDGARLRLEPGQTVIPHGPDRELTVTEVLPSRKRL
jgi:Domain of unknown function (DUF427)